MNFKIKKSILVLVFMGTLCSAFAGVNTFWDFGRVSATGVFTDEGALFRPTLEIPEFYIIGEKTGLFASFCPFEMNFSWAPERARTEGENEILPWQLDSISFVNFNLGWSKNLTDSLLLQTYVRGNAVNVMNINQFKFSPTAELSWTPDFIFDIFEDSPVPFMLKAVYLKGGAEFSNTKNFKPDYFVGLGLDFIIFASMSACFGK